MKQLAKSTARDLGPAAPPPALACMFMRPGYLEGRTTAWVGHIPFAFWLIEALRPSVFVELGTHYGNSYFGFCQGVEKIALNTCCYAVDTWRGDDHAGHYGEEVFEQVSRHNQANYAGFSTLIRSTFDEALDHFEDGTVDLLHIDGLHSYEAVRHDFESWLPKLSERAVVLFHDTNVKSGSFGVGKYFHKLAEDHPSFEFHHSNGLGVLGVGRQQSEALVQLYAACTNPFTAQSFHNIFSRLGQSCLDILEARSAEARISEHQRLIETQRLDHERALVSAAKSKGELAERISLMAREKASLQTEMEGSLSRLVELEKVSGERAGTIERMEGEMQRLREGMELKGRERGELANRITILEQEKQDLGQLHGELQTRIEEISHVNAEREEEIKNLNQRLSDELVISEARKSELANLQNQLEIGEQTVNERDQRVVLLEEEKQNLESQLGRERGELANRITTLEQEKQHLGQLHGEVQTRIEEISHVNAEREEEIKRLNQRLSDELVISEARMSELAILQDELQIREQTVKERDQRVTLLEDERQNLESHQGRERGELANRITILEQEKHHLAQFHREAQERHQDLYRLASERAVEIKNLNQRLDESFREMAELVKHLLEAEQNHEEKLTQLATLASENGRLCMVLLRKETEHGEEIANLTKLLFTSETKNEILGHQLAYAGRGCLSRSLEAILHPQQAAILRSGQFDAEWYLATYPDVLASGIDPLTHYCREGWKEGRDPSSQFKTNSYLEKHTDVRESGINPLYHYVRFGHSEGR
jgi:hypothetical protein